MSATASLTGAYIPQVYCNSGGGIKEQGIGYSTTRFNPIIPSARPYPAPLTRFSTTRPIRLSLSSPRRWSSNGGIGGPVHSRKKGNIWKRHTTMLDEHLTQAPDQHKCFCGLRYRPRRQIGVNGFTSRVFSDKSSFHLSGNRLGNGFSSQDSKVKCPSCGSEKVNKENSIMCLSVSKILNPRGEIRLPSWSLNSTFRPCS